MEGGKSGADAALVEMRGIRKSFGSVEALRGVDFRVNAAEIVGLLGDNGAGKSTLIKVLSGLYGADAGTFLFRGRKLDWTRSCVSRARGLGIETVYQDRALGLQQSLWRNVFVGRHIKDSWGLIDVAEECRVTAELLARMGLGGGRLTPDTRAGVLSGGERQGLAIGRAMYFDAELVVLDEPTTALALSEVDKVLEFICGVREKGKSVVFITHSIDHVWAVADRFVVLSHGLNAGEWTRGELTLPELTAHLREVAL